MASGTRPCRQRLPMLTKSKGKTDMMNLLKRLWKEEQGQDLIEYALLVALVALAATAGMNALANSINTEFNNLGTSLTTVT
jgi:pilus assembly protein Flp/PilA